MPYGTAVTNLAPTYTVNVATTNFPASGSTNDFTSPVTYTVIDPLSLEGEGRNFNLGQDMRPEAASPIWRLHRPHPRRSIRFAA